MNRKSSIQTLQRERYFESDERTIIAVIYAEGIFSIFEERCIISPFEELFPSDYTLEKISQKTNSVIKFASAINQYLKNVKY